MPYAQSDAGKAVRARALCVTGRRLSSEAGAEALRAGGNAFDAAAAAGFMEAVIVPAMCGIGGYAATGVGFLARPGRLVALDANAAAPASARATMFPVVPGREPNTYTLADDRHKVGPLAVAVPGVLAGLVALQKNWGKLDRKAVIAPAARKAREGVELTPGMAQTWLRLEARAEGGREPSKSEVPKVIKMPVLADTLDAVAEEGADVFYKGRIGRAIAEHVRTLGGILTADDLASYRPLVVEPVTVTVRGHVLATPPPGSGGLSSLQMAALFDRLDRAGKAGEAGSGGAFEAWLEIDKVVWEERLTTLADARTMPRPPADLLADGHLERLLVRVLEGLRDPRPGRVVAPDPLRGTSHVAAADGDGNLVAWTQTHGGGFGAQVMVPGTGVVLGHGMCRFEPRPGWANSVAPGKRPLHNMCPAVVVKDGRAVLALGATGGRTIVNNVAALAAGRLVLGLDPASAVAAPRLQCETVEPAVLERSAGPAVFEALRARGHRLREANRDAGSAHLIARDADGWVGVPEPRLATAAAVGA